MSGFDDGWDAVAAPPPLPARGIRQTGSSAEPPPEAPPASSYTAGGTADVDELLSLDSDDASLRRYKQQLLGSAAAGDRGDTTDARRIVITEFRVVLEDPATPDLVHALDTAGGVARLSRVGVEIREGANGCPRRGWDCVIFGCVRGRGRWISWATIGTRHKVCSTHQYKFRISFP